MKLFFRNNIPPTRTLQDLTRDVEDPLQGIPFHLNGKFYVIIPAGPIESHFESGGLRPQINADGKLEYPCLEAGTHRVVWFPAYTELIHHENVETCELSSLLRTTQASTKKWNRKTQTYTDYQQCFRYEDHYYALVKNQSTANLNVECKVGYISAFNLYSHTFRGIHKNAQIVPLDIDVLILEPDPTLTEKFTKRKRATAEADADLQLDTVLPQAFDFERCKADFHSLFEAVRGLAYDSNGCKECSDDGYCLYHRDKYGELDNAHLNLFRRIYLEAAQDAQGGDP